MKQDRRAIAMGLAAATCALGLHVLLGDTPEQSETPMVELNVNAVDNHGQPVTDLTAADFQVADAGKPQTIVFFRHAEDKLAPPPTLAPNEFSNRQGAHLPRATVILLDLLSEGFGGGGYSTDQLVRALTPLESAQDLYLYILNAEGRLYAVQGVPEEGQPVTAGEPWTRQAKPLLDKALRQVTAVHSPSIDLGVRLKLTFSALDNLAAYLSRIPGRKNIVWITRGLPIYISGRESVTGEPVDLTPQVRQFSEALDRAGIAIYPVRQVLLDVPDAADEFASLTGGRPDAGKDPAAAIRQAMSDVRTSYQLGYYPPPKNWDSKFHKLHVVCMRKGVRVEAKSGYYAWPEPVGERAQEAINRVAAAPFDAAEIGLRAKLAPAASGGNAAHLAARIDPGDIAWIQSGNQSSASLLLAMVQYPADGKPAISPITPLDLHETGQQLEEAKKDGIAYSQDVMLGPNLKGLRLIVFDWSLNTIGSVSLPVPEPRN
jgi:VWFA-related protein